MIAHAEERYLDGPEDYFDDINPAEIREKLAQRGIVGGKVVDPEALSNDPFIQQVVADAEAVQRELSGEEAEDAAIVARYLSDEERIVIQQYPNGEYHIRYGYTSDWLITYVRHGASNSRKLLEYAQRREKKGLIQIINLAEENSCERNTEVEK